MKLLVPVIGILLLVNCNSAQIYVCGSHVSAKTPLCSELFQAFQAALTKSETNLFNLRNIFFPPSEASPVLLNISYVIDFGNITDISCTNDTNNTIYGFETFYKNYGWTSVVIYTIFHPATINRLQPQLFYWIMKKLEPGSSKGARTAFNWEGISDSFLTLELSMYIPSLSCSPSKKQVENTLKGMTSVVSLLGFLLLTLAAHAQRRSRSVCPNIYLTELRYGLSACFFSNRGCYRYQTWICGYVQRALGTAKVWNGVVQEQYVYGGGLKLYTAIVLGVRCALGIDRQPTAWDDFAPPAEIEATCIWKVSPQIVVEKFIKVCIMSVE